MNNIYTCIYIFIYIYVSVINGEMHLIIKHFYTWSTLIAYFRACRGKGDYIKLFSRSGIKVEVRKEFIIGGVQHYDEWDPDNFFWPYL